MTNPLKIISKKEFLKENKEPNQEEAWDSISDSWNEYRNKEIPIVVSFLKDKKGIVIDVGCGSGRNMIKKDDIEYYGVDFSEKMINLTKEHVKEKKIKAKLFRSSADKLDKEIFRNEMFDYGLFIATLHCLETAEERENALKEFYRVLKKNAEAIISVWNSEDERFKDKGKDVYMSWRKGDNSVMRYYHLYDKQELMDLLESVGFKILKQFEVIEHDRFSKKNLIFKIRK